eukprot:TCONS_00039154-protein
MPANGKGPPYQDGELLDMLMNRQHPLQHPQLHSPASPASDASTIPYYGNEDEEGVTAEYVPYEPEPVVDDQPEPVVDDQPEPVVDDQPEPVVDDQPEPVVD